VIRVAVLAASAMGLARLEALLASRAGLTVVSGARAGSGAAVDADVLVVDPGGRRPDAVVDALAPAPRRPPIVLLAGAAAPGLSPRLLRAGVRAVLPQDASAVETVAAVEAAAAGLVVLHASAVATLGSRASDGRGRAELRAGPALTGRELEVLAMMAEGIGNRAIAARLGISTHTVKFHIAAILDKLNARTRAEAVAIGMRLGLLLV
jgi:two-component system, NarL family, response regulator YdfI